MVPRTPSHKFILLLWLTGVWPQTEVLLGSKKLDLVEVSERVFSGNVCNKGQAEFGEGKQSTLCSTGPSIRSTVRESLGQGALTSPRSQMGSWFPSLLFQYGVSFLCHLLARAPGKQKQNPFLCVVQDYQKMGGGFILGGRCFKLVKGSSQCLTCSQSCPCFCSAWRSCQWGSGPRFPVPAAPQGHLGEMGSKTGAQTVTSNVGQDPDFLESDLGTAVWSCHDRSHQSR